MKYALAVIAFVLASALPTQRADALLCVAILGCSCNVTAADIEFGDINPLAGAQEGTGHITVDCTGIAEAFPSVSTRITRGTWGTFAARKMRNSLNGDLLDYQIYREENGPIWGDGTSSTVAVTINGGALALGHWTTSRDVYAMVSPTIATRPGNFSDTAVVRIVW